MKYHDRMEIDFVKCESERPRSETCGAKSETRRSASFPSNHHSGMSQPKRQSAAERAANDPLLATVRKQEGHVKSISILKLKGCKFLPPSYVVRQGFAQAFASTSQKWLWRYTHHFIAWPLNVGEVHGPFAFINIGASRHFLGQPPCCVWRKTLYSLLGQAELAGMSPSGLFNRLEICLQPFHPAQDLNAARTQLRNSSLLFLQIMPHILQD